MAGARDRRTTWTLAASAAAHAVVLAIAFAQHPTIAIPDTPEAPAPDVIQVQLLPRQPPPARRVQARTTAAPRREVPPPPILHAPVPPSAAQAPAAPTAAVPAPPADLTAALRHGVVGCANLRLVGMSRREREGCEERLGRGVASERFLPAPIGSRVRAYYDQVALAKAPDGPFVPLTAHGKGDVFATDPRPVAGHGPGIGCKWPPPKLPHALMIGPCYIEPPQGSLTPEVDIAPP